MTVLKAAARAKAKRANFVHITLRGVEEEETDALERYVQDCVTRQARGGPEVHWYEVVLRGDSRRQRYVAQVTAHLRDQDVFVAQTSPNPFLAVRDAFHAVARRLHRLGDPDESRARGLPEHE